MKYIRTTIVLGLAVLAAACGPKAETSANQANDAAPVAATMNDTMGNMAMAPDAATLLMAKGHGTVTAIDKAGGTITLDHGPIPEAKTNAAPGPPTPSASFVTREHNNRST